MKIILIATTILLSILAGLAIATDEVSLPAPSPEIPVSPMMLEINAIQDASHHAVAELSLSLGSVRGTENVLAVQREISRIKAEAQLETMRVQLRFAVAEGHTDVAAKLETIIYRMTTPQPKATQTRPAPVQNGQR